MAVFIRKLDMEEKSVDSASTTMCLEKIWSSYDGTLKNSVDQRDGYSDSDIDNEVIMV